MRIANRHHRSIKSKNRLLKTYVSSLNASGIGEITVIRDTIISDYTMLLNATWAKNHRGDRHNEDDRIVDFHDDDDDATIVIIQKWSATIIHRNKRNGNDDYCCAYA